MAIYWSKNSIPALHGLSAKERMTLIQPVIGAVWRRWQVWVPALTQAVLAFAFIFLAPPFPYRLPAVIIAAVITVKIAFLPFNHFLALELDKVKSQVRLKRGAPKIYVDD